MKKFLLGTIVGAAIMAYGAIENAKLLYEIVERKSVTTYDVSQPVDLTSNKNDFDKNVVKTSNRNLNPTPKKYVLEVGNGGVYLNGEEVDVELGDVQVVTGSSSSVFDWFN